ncbi:tetratricopeptide repeat protein [Glutamicibacter sp. BW77]|uniref:tetratricopeptide repeat protein n=1 Tax=Glutamicibacter sp. BW77 TaxID=2024402 RepID=UPI000BB8CE30|nr:tetratricopeptide repeat protein [Glutamicibacter sp. BW77]PCC37441.1 hypothetical protein CIK74_00540 [Glutamicibacter sp. BW77]
MTLDENHPPLPDKIQRLIDAINMQHVWALRKLHGKDLGDHVQVLIELETDKRYDEMIALLEEITELMHTLEQYDTREPQPYYAEKLASIYIKLGSHDDAIRALRRWLDAWPADRLAMQPASGRRSPPELPD